RRGGLVRADAASERRMTAMALPAMEIADGAQQVLLDKVLLSDNTPFGQTRKDEDSLNDDSIKAEAAEILRPLPAALCRIASHIRHTAFRRCSWNQLGSVLI